MLKTKVLWIITGGLRRNGICVSQLEYARRIDKEKFELDIAAVHNNSQEMINDYVNAKCNIIEFTDRRKNVFKYLRELKKTITKNKYDIVHVFGSSAIMGLELDVAKKSGVKCCIAHSRNTTCDRLFLEKMLRKKFKNKYDIALSCGKDAGEWLFPKENYYILHNGKDLKRYAFKPEVRKKIRENLELKDELTFGHVGNFNKQKNHTFLIDLFSKINDEYPNSKLFLMGNGQLIDEIKEKVKKNGLEKKVYFLGSVDNVEELIQAMDIMLLPSLFEGLPNVVIEWQASGVPCILSDKITKECSVSNLVNFASIDNGEQEWIDCIKNIRKADNEQRLINSKEACNNLIKNKFEINENVKILQELYEENIWHKEEE